MSENKLPLQSEPPTVCPPETPGSRSEPARRPWAGGKRPDELPPRKEAPAAPATEQSDAGRPKDSGRLGA
jgi:hypothetical protein